MTFSAHTSESGDSSLSPNNVIYYHFKNLKRLETHEISPLNEAICKLSFLLMPTFHSYYYVTVVIWLIVMIQRFKIIAFLTFRDSEGNFIDSPLQKVLNIFLSSSMETKSPFVYLTYCILAGFSIAFYLFGLKLCYDYKQIGSTLLTLIMLFSICLCNATLIPFIAECTRFLLKHILGQISQNLVQLLIEMILVASQLFLLYIQYCTCFNSTLYRSNIYATFTSFHFMPFSFIMLTILQVTSEFFLSNEQIYYLFVIIYFFFGICFIYNGLRHVYIHEDGNAMACSFGFTFLAATVHGILKICGISADDIMLYVMLLILILSYAGFHAIIKKTQSNSAKELMNCKMNFEKLKIKTASDLIHYMQSGFNNGIKSAIDGSFLEWGIHLYGINELFYVMIRYATIVKTAPYYMSYIDNLYSKAHRLGQIYVIYEYETIQKTRITNHVPSELKEYIDEFMMHSDHFLKLESILANYLCNDVNTNFLITCVLYHMKNRLRDQIFHITAIYPNCIAVLKMNESFARDLEENDRKADKFKLIREALKSGYINSASCIGYLPYHTFPITQKFIFQNDHDIELNSLDESGDDISFKGNDDENDNSNDEKSSNAEIDDNDKEEEIKTTKQETKMNDKSTHNSSFIDSQNVVLRMFFGFALICVVCILLAIYGTLFTVFTSVEVDQWIMNTTDTLNSYMDSCYLLLTGSLELLLDPVERTIFNQESANFTRSGYFLSSLRYPSQYTKTDPRSRFSSILREGGLIDDFYVFMAEFQEKLRLLLRTESQTDSIFEEILNRYYQLLIMSRELIAEFSSSLLKTIDYADSIYTQNFIYFNIPLWVFSSIGFIYWFSREVYVHLSALPIKLQPKKDLVIPYFAKHYGSYTKENCIIFFIFVIVAFVLISFSFSIQACFNSKQEFMHEYISLVHSDALSQSFFFQLVACAELYSHIDTIFVEQWDLNFIILTALNYFTNGTTKGIVLHQRIDQSPYFIFVTMFDKYDSGSFYYTVEENSIIRQYYREYLVAGYRQLSKTTTSEKQDEVFEFIDEVELICIVFSFLIFISILSLFQYFLYYNLNSLEFPYMLERMSPSALAEFGNIVQFQKENSHLIDYLQVPAALITQSGVITHVNPSWLSRIDDDEKRTIGSHYYTYNRDFLSVKLSQNTYLLMVRHLDEDLKVFQKCNSLENELMNLRNQICPRAVADQMNGEFDTRFTVLVALSILIDNPDIEVTFKQIIEHFLEVTTKQLNYSCFYDILKGSPTTLLILFGFGQEIQPEYLMAEVFIFCTNLMLTMIESKFGSNFTKPMMLITCGDTTISLKEESLGDINLSGEASSKMMAMHPYGNPFTISMCGDSYELMQEIGIDIKAKKVAEDTYQISFNDK